MKPHVSSELWESTYPINSKEKKEGKNYLYLPTILLILFLKRLEVPPKNGKAYVYEPDPGAASGGPAVQHCDPHPGAASEELLT